MYKKILIVRSLAAIAGVILLIPLIYISFQLGQVSAENKNSSERIKEEKQNPNRGNPGKGKKVTPTPSPSITSPIQTPTPPLFPSATPIPSPNISPTIIPPIGSTWDIQSVSSMKETKDRVCNPRSEEFINNWVLKAKKLGVGYIALETPYENPSCGDSLEYSKKWIRAIRTHGLKVWHRHMPITFEGIYGTTKIQSDFLGVIGDYIKKNPLDFQEGDIFTPIPEPQNGGIMGVTYCPQSICQFSTKEAFNTWIRNAMDTSEQAFYSIGLGGKIKIGYFGFDGFVAWGDNNPDWNGILEDATIQKMGNITIDHYPQLVGSVMSEDLNELEARYPGIPIIIGEWGSVGDGDKEKQVVEAMSAAKRSSVRGFNYWHMGVGGNEALIDENFSENIHYDEVQGFFTGSR